MNETPRVPVSQITQISLRQVKTIQTRIFYDIIFVVSAHPVMTEVCIYQQNMELPLPSQTGSSSLYKEVHGIIAFDAVHGRRVLGLIAIPDRYGLTADTGLLS